MILSREKPVICRMPHLKKGCGDGLSLDGYINNRDYTGAIAYLEFEKEAKQNVGIENDLWRAYSLYHLKQYDKAYEIYSELLDSNETSELWLSMACCAYFLGWYGKSQHHALKGDDCGLKWRILFHTYGKLDDHCTMMSYYSKLGTTNEDRLSIASVHFKRKHYADALAIYKGLWSFNQDWLAVRLYITVCYFKMEFYDVAHQLLGLYLRHYPDSAMALNLKACIMFKMASGGARSALMELKKVSEEDGDHNLSYIPSCTSSLIGHNMAVFSNDEHGLESFSLLLEEIPEARMNLAIYYLRKGKHLEAYKLVKDVEVSNTREYLVKAGALCSYGQDNPDIREPYNLAIRLYQLGGKAAAEDSDKYMNDAVQSRQCMASYHFMRKEFDECLAYLETVKDVMYNDDTFNFNYAQVKTALGHYKEAIRIYLLIVDTSIRRSFTCAYSLAKCYIHTKKSEKAWNLYTFVAPTLGAPSSYRLLHFIASECYKTHQYYISMKAYDLLERLDPLPEYWEGKRAACIAVFRDVIAHKEPRETMQEVIEILVKTPGPVVNFSYDKVIAVMQDWEKRTAVSLVGTVPVDTLM